MSKRELIDAILQHNRTATPQFLARFAENDLKAYLQRVCVISTVKLRELTTPESDKRQELVFS